jgi:hypothetical protein
MKKIDIAGQKFERLLALHPTDRRSNGRIVWVFLCDCGATKEAGAALVKHGHIKSCGCLAKEGTRTTHGMRRTSEYGIWSHMLSRCNNKNNPAYALYGGRGITVDQRWLSFENFMSDMGTRPSKQHSLDRINCDGGYSPQNCRWATHKQQQRNRRNNKVMEANGLTATFAEHCESSGVKYQTAFMRLKKGAPIDVVLLPSRLKRGQLRSA